MAPPALRVCNDIPGPATSSRGLAIPDGDHGVAVIDDPAACGIERGLGRDGEVEDRGLRSGRA